MLPPGTPLVALVLLAVATLRRLSVPGDEMRTFRKTGFRMWEHIRKLSSEA